MAGLAERVPLPVWVQDVLLAVFVTLMQIQGTREAGANAPPEIDFRPLTDLGYLGYILLTISGLVLVVRRRWPVLVFVVTAIVSVVYFTLGFADGPGSISLFVALYTVTAHGDGRRSIRIVAAGIAVLAVVWLVTADIRSETAGWLVFRIGATIMAAALGESVRSRRVIATEAQERAERAERTREEEARRQVDAERLRIAREVHDTVAHAVAIINVQAGVSAHILDKRPERVRDTLLTIEQTSAHALREMRGILGVLRGGDDAERPPAASLRHVDEIVTMAREAGLDVRVEADSAPPDLPSTVDGAAYRILQESITNVIRHAGPARVTISIESDPAHLEIRVVDDGSGADGVPLSGVTRSPEVDSGRGLVGMRERCELLGGTFEAGPRPAGGFEVRARLPLAPTGAVTQ